MPESHGHEGGLHTCWRDGLSVVNLRGRPDDPAFLAVAREALGAALPTEPCRTVTATGLRIVWAGPDDWFVIGSAESVDPRVERLRAGLNGLHAALTDVGSGYKVLRLSGPPVREVLAQGCPLDLHPRAFGRDQCAGTHYFKASVWLWPVADGDGFELLVRRSFMGYVDLMLTRSTLECGRTGP